VVCKGNRKFPHFSHKTLEAYRVLNFDPYNLKIKLFLYHKPIKMLNEPAQKPDCPTLRRPNLAFLQKFQKCFEFFFLTPEFALEI
jgi:hypothetical protein